MKVSILSNTNTASLVNRVSKEYPCYTPNGYGVWMQELLNTQSEIYNDVDCNVFILIDGNELFQNNIDDSHASVDTIFSYLHQAIQFHPSTSFFISNLDIINYVPNDCKTVPEHYTLMSYWDKLLAQTLELFPNAFLFDLRELVSRVGQEQFYSNLLWYSGSFSFSAIGEKKIVQRLSTVLRAKYKSPKKCLVLDLDNTLWGGVLGEEGPTGILLAESKQGAQFRDFQRIIKRLQATGVLLCIASKNNESDVEEVFEKNEFMILANDDFVIKKINWLPKAESIASIAKDLNIGLDSIVFVDDNPVERSAIASIFPSVSVPDFPKLTVNLREFAYELYLQFFYKLTKTKEDISKTQLYLENINRTDVISKGATQSDFLKTLGTNVVIGRNSDVDVERISQLTLKTNQFNLTTRRYQTADILKFIHSLEHDVFSAKIKDKFGNLGLSIVLITRILPNHTVEIDTFLESCRVMGRYLEHQFLYQIEAYYREQQVEKIVSHYISTSKNKPVAIFFEACGYEVVEEHIEEDIQYKTYEKLLSNAQVYYPFDIEIQLIK